MEKMRRRDMKRKGIMKKMKVFRKHSLQRQHSSGCSIESGSDAKLIMLRRNNVSLAKALSDQKIETTHWYTETISLRGELQELQEKLLKGSAININVENMFVEQERQIKEYYESIDQDFNAALDKIVKAVEKITKIKQLMNSLQIITQNSTQGPTNVFSRTPGSRVNLSSSGANTPPRQRAVPPMIGGQVLQPVSVPLSKLKIDWNDRRTNRLHVSEDNDRNMTTIGEQSSPETSEVIEDQQTVDTEQNLQLQNNVTPDHNLPQPHSDLVIVSPETRLGDDIPRRYGLRRKKTSPTNSQATSPVDVTVCNGEKKQSRRRRGRGSGRGRNPTSRISKSPLEEGREVHTSVIHDDPLEGPSWLLDVGRSRFHPRSRKAKTHRQNSASVPSVTAGLESSDEDIDDDVSPMSSRDRPRGCKSRKSVGSPVSLPKANVSLSLDHSCLHSPTSMRDRLEALEAAGGRKCKRFLKRRNRFVNSETLEDTGEDVALRLEGDERDEQQTTPNTEDIVLRLPTPKNMCTGVDSGTEDNSEVTGNTSPPFIYESPGIPREDNDVTCKIITNMDITLPVSNLIIQEHSATSIERNIDGLQDDFKFNQSKKKFFKTKKMELSEEIPAKGERTPFDISMINESLMEMPPFSSTRRTEKENLPPISAEGCNEYASLCNVSVVLEDVMKRPEYVSKTPKELLQSPQKESQSAKCVSSTTPRKLRSVSRRTLQYTVNYDEDIEEIKKPKRARKKCGITPNHELKTTSTNSTKPLNENSDTKPMESEDLQQQQQQPSENRKNPQEHEDQQVSGNRKNPQECEDQQPSENRKDNQGCEEEVEAASDTSPDTLTNSCVGTEINTDNVQKKGEHNENVQTGLESDVPEESDCIVIEDLNEEQHIQDTHPKQSDSKNYDVAANPNIGFEGFQNSETFQIPIALKSFSDRLEKEKPVECDDEVQNSSDKGSAEENSSRNHCRKRRAAVKISSFKEASLNRKLRRGENDVIIIAEKRRNRSKGRGKRNTKDKSVDT